ncbi:nitrate reductase subunit alpha [Cellulomonas triticagri]|uniref:nitrate reductase (quinone) n=1 Tax=Cellulomonas triticagri TaxID=2483352 RepID=A0A3M2J8W6_9CELL|nr:nitrate reductase subunit alpha [Cellulomonas triticagri]RMI09344.1 nitrate reductase subunit alpha [Cellulomonas triticagri]
MTADPLSPLVRTLLEARGRLPGAEVLAGDHAVIRTDASEGDAPYRDRWSHDKVVRSTHGVNCTGSCAWDVYVTDGLITWEHQGTDYPTTGPDSPEYEPRGCPRGASFSWYTYSPGRVRYPYVRGVLLEMYLDARCRTGDPVAAWAEIVESPLKATLYKRARGTGGFVRADWDLAVEIQAAAHVHTIKTYGPDRCVGFTPIPAMSMASFAAGTRFLSLIGGTLLSFYDWYADLPPASPQVWGDQTDVPESADWWNSGYLILWGSNVPVTRTPDAHFLAEVRYKGAKVVAVSPDYAENVTFADDWLAPAPGTDGALAQAMGHVLLTEFFRDRQVPYFEQYVRRFTDAPFLVALEETAEPGVLRPGKFVTAEDVPQVEGALGEHPAFRPVLLDARTDRVVVPPGTLADRWAPEGLGRWNLDLADVEPVTTLHGATHDGAPAQGVAVALPRFDAGDTEGGASITRGVPAVRVGGRLVTTVLDLLMARYGVPRPGLPGTWPTGYDDADDPSTPGWQAAITGVPVEQCVRIAREFTRNAEVTEGRSMILMGAGTNHWFHSDTIYRTFLTLLTLTGCQGVNGGGWAHYVGQEKARPVTGQQHMSFALDWQRPTRHMTSTSFWYVATDQWRYEGFGTDELASPVGRGTAGSPMPRSTMDCLVQASRLGWTPSHPGFDRNPLDLCDEAAAAGRSVPDHVVGELTSGRLRFAVQDPDAPANVPRVLTTWRANLVGNSAKGNEYFIKHLLGASHALRHTEMPPERRPSDVVWRDEAPEGKLDLLTNIDFRMTSSSLFADIVLPAATWYEKQDISTTDMHPYVHALNAAIAPPWQARSDHEAFLLLADKVAELAEHHLGTRTDVIAAPLTTDTPDELAQPHGVVRDWAAGECEPVPGLTMPRLVVIERDYTAIGQKMRAVGPLISTLGTTVKGVTVIPEEAVEHLGRANGLVTEGVAAGRPRLDTAAHLCEAILALSGTTNGTVSLAGFERLQERVGRPLADLAEENAGRRVTFADTLRGPQPVFTSYEWSGSEHGGRRYSPFVINVERDKPWHTLTGRQHFYLDHDWLAELGEQLPVYRPPLDMARHFGDPADAAGRHEAQVTVRYLTPHSKWSIHSQFQDNPYMLALSRGGPTIWLSVADAEAAGIADNDWIEGVNRNGVVVARAVVSHRMPTGTAYMYHSKDRNIDVPRAEASGIRGGTHNALTAILLKPTHLLGGYAQLTYAFNYYGPTGNQRDELTVVRRRSQEVQY